MSVIGTVILTAGMVIALLCAVADQVLLSRIGGKPANHDVAPPAEILNSAETPEDAMPQAA